MDEVEEPKVPVSPPELPEQRDSGMASDPEPPVAPDLSDAESSVGQIVPEEEENPEE